MNDPRDILAARIADLRAENARLREFAEYVYNLDFYLGFAGQEPVRIVHWPLKEKARAALDSTGKESIVASAPNGPEAQEQR